MLEASCYYDGVSGHDWVLSPWTQLSNTTVSIKVDGTTATTYTINSSGILSIPNLTKGLHRFRVDTAWDNSYYFYDQNNNQVTFEMPSVVGMHFERRFN